jgi:hypothetical protein
MTTYITDGGTNRTVTKISVKDGGTWQTVKKAYVKDGGTWQLVFGLNSTLTGVQSASGCYSGQGGFSVDFINGVTTLTMGAWPTDPPNCQTCDWTWLQLNGAGANGLSNNSSSNNYRRSNNIRPYWTMSTTLDIDAMSIGSTLYPRINTFPYNLVSYTYAVTKNSANSISIVPYPNAWGTGDTGTSISVNSWWRNVVSLGGGDPDNPNLGSINLSW